MATITRPKPEPGTEWTSRRGKCGFCSGQEAGYSKKDTKGKWRPSCWPCIRIDPKPKKGA